MSRHRQQPANDQDRNYLAEFNSDADAIINGAVPAQPGRRPVAAAPGVDQRGSGHDPMALVRLQSKAQSTISELQQELFERTTELSTLSDAHEALETAHQTATAELTNIGTRMREIESNHATTLGEVSQRAVTAEAQVTTLTQAKTDLEGQLEALKQEKAALEARVNTLTQEKADLEQRVNADGAAALGLPPGQQPAAAAAAGATATPPAPQGAAAAATGAAAGAVAAGASTQQGDQVSQRANLSREQVSQQVALNADPNSPQGQEAILRQAVQTWQEWQVKLNKAGSTKAQMEFQAWYAGDNYKNVQLGLQKGYHLRQISA